MFANVRSSKVTAETLIRRQRIVRNFLIISLADAFILISLDKLRKLTGFPNPLNTKGTNFLIGTANFFTRLEIKAQTLSGCFTAELAPSPPLGRPRGPSQKANWLLRSRSVGLLA